MKNMDDDELDANLMDELSDSLSDGESKKHFPKITISISMGGGEEGEVSPSDEDMSLNRRPGMLPDPGELTTMMKKVK